MILSFHPIYEADQNRLCAGRDPDAADLAALERAKAVILPQGCRRSLYEAARQRCRYVFPDYSARFAYPGKIGQIRLFQGLGAPHPRSVVFADTGVFFKRHPSGKSPLAPPAVVKLNWGGEGEGVFPIGTISDLERILTRLQAYERTGQRGFILQEWIPAGGRSLRVVVVGHRLLSYWRVMPSESAARASLSGGGRIDRSSDRHLMAAAEAAVQDLCRRTGINLAGFDILFSRDPSIADPARPLFLEINYFFGRRGFRGSETYYQWLTTAIDQWLHDNADTPGKREGALPP
jgi:ribosomal protein S6--L-glutamate ligase